MEKPKLQSCCFTGHRKLPVDQVETIMSRTEEQVRRLIGAGVERFLVGGAVGYDTEVARLLFRLRETEYAGIHVELIYPFDSYTDRWTPIQKAEHAALLPKYDVVRRAAERDSREAFLKRDRMLVDGAAYCIAYCTKSTGGTAYTLQYAKKKGVEIYNVAEDI